MFSVPRENQSKRLEEFESRSARTRDTVEGFHLLENSHKLCRGFQQAMEELITCFISFIKLLFSFLKTKTIYKATIYFNFFHEIVTSHNLEIEQPNCSLHFRAS